MNLGINMRQSQNNYAQGYGSSSQGGSVGGNGQPNNSGMMGGAGHPDAMEQSLNNTGMNE